MTPHDAPQPPVPSIGPAAYVAWRSGSLGAITEALELSLIVDLIGNVAGKEVLDVGCGDGILACTLAAVGARVTGVDPDPAMLDAARKRAGQAGLTIATAPGRAEQLPFPDRSFDVVTAVTVLCFVEDARGAMLEIVRVLKPGGRLVIGELGRWNAWSARRRIKAWLGSPTWRAARFRSASELRRLARTAGLRVDDVRGAIFYPPIGALARLAAPIDPWLGRKTTLGAAFITIAATLPDEQPERPQC